MYAKIIAAAALAVAALLLTGCATVIEELTRDPRDAPWDPRGGAQLFDQIPNWDNAALKICCGALLGQPEEYRRARCDTATPVPPRSNRC
jgi:hypothetical protein